MNRQLIPSLIALTLAGVLGAFPAVAQNENETTGFSSTHVFDGGYFGENIDTLNGNLNLTIPIGPSYRVNKNLSYQLKLTYNSKFLDMLNDSGLAGYARLWGESPLGLGFSLSFGKAYQDQLLKNGAVAEYRWYFVTPDGNKHDMGTSISQSSWPVVSNDTTYFRALTRPDPTDGTKTEILITDGTGIRYVLHPHAVIPGLPCPDGYLTGACNPDWRELNAAFGGYYVTRIEDMTSGTPDTLGYYPNYVRVQYDAAKGYGQCISEVVDSTGRVITFTNVWDDTTDKRSARTVQVDLPKFGNNDTTLVSGAKASYTFDYCPPSPATCPADRMFQTLLPIPATYNPITFDPKRPTLRLWSIGLPEGYKISFDYSSWGSGELVKRTLPTNQTGDLSGPRMEYDYDNYAYYRRYFSQSDTQVGSFSTGVSTTGTILIPSSYTRHITQRRLYLLTDPYQFTDPLVSQAATWTYNRSGIQQHTNPDIVTMTTTVGGYANTTVHFFHSSPEPTYPDSPDPAVNGKGANDGLAPEWDDGLNYRTEYWEGLEGSGRLLRTEETTYKPDVFVVIPTPLPPYTSIFYYKDNIRTLQTVTTFNDDASKQVITSNSNWDGAGHWKDVTETGFGMTTPRITRTNYIHTAVRSDIFDYKEVSDGNAVFSRSDYEYDGSSRLFKSVDRKAPPSVPNTPVPSPLTGLEGDVVTEYIYYGTAGGPTECLAPVTGNLCKKVLMTEAPSGTQETFTITYHYNLNDAGGYLASKQFTGVLWKSIDWKRDANTGLIRRSCDPSLVCTSYLYDDLGRITTVTPGSTEFATAIRYPSLRKTEVQQSADPGTACATGVDCIYSEYIYDDAARLIETRKRDYADGMVAQRTTYDALGNVRFRSEWSRAQVNPDGSTTPLDLAGNALSEYPRTEYSYIDAISQGLDPFGRVWKVITPDGKETETLYRGADTTVTVKGVTGSGGPFDLTTRYFKDALGRLVEVSFPEGRYSSGATLPFDAAKAEYAYDPKDNLVGASLIAPDGTRQARAFAYDGLNRLIREDNPENGTTLYEWYDGLGNLRQKRDSTGNALSMTYDPAGRLLRTQNGTVLLSQNIYDEVSDGTNPYGYSAGKLTTAQSYSDVGTLQVTQKYYYSGLNGRLSGESTIFAGVITTGGLKTNYSYDNFGLRTRMIHPDEGLGRLLRDLTATYRNGFQIGLRDTVSGGVTHVTDIQYNPAGGIWKITLPGGATDVIQPDPRNRPEKITMSGFIPGGASATLFDSGLYVYDGAGNIAGIGPNSYRYDAANRLVQALEYDNDHTIPYGLTWSYDPFGNLLQSTQQIASNSPTSRSFTVFGNNRLAQMVEGAATTTFAYDGRGNVTRDASHAFNYDLRNRVVGIDSYSGTEAPVPLGSFAYDSAGQRAVKTVVDTTIYYVRDQQGQVLSEYRRPTSSYYTPAWDRDYLYAAGRLVGEAENDNPDAPSGLRSQRVLNGGGTYDVRLDWVAPSDLDLQSYKIYRCQLLYPVGCVYNLVGTVFPPVISFQKTPPSQYFTYRYKVTAVDTAAHESGSSPTLSVMAADATLPSSPTITSTVGGDRRATVTWNASSDNVGVLGYRVWRYTGSPPACEGASCLLSPETLVRTTSFTDLCLVNGTDYRYEIAAVDTAGNESIHAISATVMPADDVSPGPPSGLAAIPGCTSDDANKIFLSWEPNPPEDGVDHYTLFRNGVLIATVMPPASLNHQDTLTEGTVQATYTLTATDSVGHVSQDSPGVPVQLRLLDGSLVALTTPLVANGEDGLVRLRWKGSICVGGLSCKSFIVYRKLNMERGCEAYRRVGTVPLTLGLPDYDNPYTFSDLSVTNATAYDYALALADLSGREGGFSSAALGVPLETIKDVRRCRDPESQTVCPANDCPEPGYPCRSWVYRWNPPVTPAYQPASASALDAPGGYLKGFRVYDYDWDSGGYLKWVTSSLDTTMDYGLVADKDNQYRADDYPGDHCKVITGVYKVFVNGNWLSLESGWSNNFYADNGEALERCPSMPQGESGWCSLPVCGTENIPAAPSGVAATPGPAANQITVNWTAPASNDLIGYHLYVNDPLWDNTGTRSAARFRNHHPYLRLDSSTTSVVLGGLRPCRPYSFYVVSVNGAGRTSEPSETTPLVSALASSGDDPIVPGDLQFRPWTGNDRTFASNDAPNASTELVRVIQDYMCNNGVREQSTDLVTWTPAPTPIRIVPIFAATQKVAALMYALPAGETTFFRLRPPAGYETNPVAVEVFPHDTPPLSPPTHLDARKESLDTIHLRWCPNFATDQITGYRIFRSTNSGGPYDSTNRITNPDLPPTSYTYDDVYNATTNPITPTTVRYYYVIAAVRVEDGQEQISALSPENGAGVFNGDHTWDPDSKSDSLWMTQTPPTADDRLMYCDDDYVENRPDVGNPLTSPPAGDSLEHACGPDSEEMIERLSIMSAKPPLAPAPYRTVGVLAVPFHYTYYHLDHLGSPRILTDSAGVRVQGQHFLPFGEEMPIEGGTNTRKFTGHERDAETGLDYMLARYYSAQLGRFLAVDPEDDSELEIPQSWNKYAYVRNNPLAFIDPNGAKVTYANTPEVQHQRGMAEQLADQSPTFRAEIDAHSGADPDLNFKGGEGLPAGQKGAAETRVDPETQEYEYTDVRIDNSEHYTDGDLKTTIIEELGHANAARTNPEQAYKNRGSEKKTEQAARKFMRQVKKEIRQFKREQRRQERQAKREQKQQERQQRKKR